jgi:hypothetical protein
VELLGDMLFVELVEGMLFGELAKVTGDWLWRNGRIGSVPEVGLGCSDSVVVQKRRKGWRILLVVRSPLHGVVDFLGCSLLRRLYGILVHFCF